MADAPSLSSSSPTKPRILVLGGSGRTGKLVIAAALARGYTVTALVRNSASLTPPQPGLTVVQGTPLDAADMESAMTATVDTPKVILSTLGQTRASGNPWAATTSPPRFMADAMTNALAIAEKYAVAKVVVLSMFGAGGSFANLNFLMRGIMRWSNMAQTLEDHNLVDQAVRQSMVSAFVLVRAAMLMGNGVSTVRELGEEGERAGFMHSISAESAASFLLDVVDSDAWNGRTPVISV